MNEIARAERGGPLTVAVLSMMAAATGGRHGFLWNGEVPAEWLPPDAAAADFGAVNESLFRYFNRVEEDDARRLEASGYLLPSLSWGDLIGYRDRVFRVAAIGFESMPGKTVLETVALALSQLRDDSQSPASGSGRAPELGAAVAQPAVPTDAQGVALARLMRAQRAILVTAAIGGGRRASDVHVSVTRPDGSSFRAGVSLEGEVFISPAPRALTAGRELACSARERNRATHSIQHRCFPPKPDRCLICDREGAELDREPCLWVAGEPNAPQ